MPVKNKLTTSRQAGDTQTLPQPLLLPDQAEFHQRLKEQARAGLRVLLEKLMQEELQALLGAGWGEHTAERKGYRNGFYTRDLGTTQGVIEDLKVPRDREGQFQTQVFENYARYEPQVEEGLREMFVAGVSTAKVGEVAETLIGVAPPRARLAASIVTCKSSSKPGVNVLWQLTGGSFIVTGSTSRFVTANKPIGWWCWRSWASIKTATRRCWGYGSRPKKVRKAGRRCSRIYESAGSRSLI